MIRPQMALFVPSIETVKDGESFLTEEPLKLLNEGRFNHVPVLTGYNADEGLLHSPGIFLIVIISLTSIKLNGNLFTLYSHFISALAANKTKMDEAKNFLNWAPKVMHFDSDMREVGASAKIREFYFGSESKMQSMSETQLLKKFTDLWGDRLFMVGVAQSAIIETRTNPNPTYLYLFEHEGGFSLTDLMYQLEDCIHPVFGILLERATFLFKSYILGQNVPHIIPGTCHGDESAMLFSGLLQRINFRGTDEQMSKDFVKLWVDFASGK